MVRRRVSASNEKYLQREVDRGLNLSCRAFNRITSILSGSTSRSGTSSSAHRNDDRNDLTSRNEVSVIKRRIHTGGHRESANIPSARYTVRIKSREITIRETIVPRATTMRTYEREEPRIKFTRRETARPFVARFSSPRSCLSIEV